MSSHDFTCVLLSCSSNLLSLDYATGSLGDFDTGHQPCRKYYSKIFTIIGHISKAISDELLVY
jgi:hypothetical protein